MPAGGGDPRIQMISDWYDNARDFSSKPTRTDRHAETVAERNRPLKQRRTQLLNHYRKQILGVLYTGLYRSLREALFLRYILRYLERFLPLLVKAIPLTGGIWSAGAGGSSGEAPGNTGRGPPGGSINDATLIGLNPTTPADYPSQPSHLKIAMLEKIINRGISRREFLKGAVAGIGLSLMPGFLLKVEAGEVDSHSMIANRFRELGWKVYDDPGLKSMPRKKLQYRITKQEVLDNYSSFVKYFHKNEIGLIEILLNNSITDDELRFVFVTSDDSIFFSVISHDKSIGRNGKYAIIKKVNISVAGNLRKVSPFYK